MMMMMVMMMLLLMMMMITAHRAPFSGQKVSQSNQSTTELEKTLPLPCHSIFLFILLFRVRCCCCCCFIIWLHACALEQAQLYSHAEKLAGLDVGRCC
jgi:hypothetical protein